MDDNYIQELESQLTQNGSNADATSYGMNSLQHQSDNLVVFQLELDNILERIEHLLRGDVLKEVDGNLIYTEPDNNDLKLMNDYGVQLIMNLLSFYLNRNTILSNYEQTRIYEILYDLGNELADLIYINYEKMGLDTPGKQSRYPFIVMNILHMVESAYNRSIGGNELESLRSARVVTQSQPLGNGGQMQQPQQKQRFSLNPFKRFS